MTSAPFGPRVLFARHRILPEIGDAGIRLLAESEAVLPPGLDAAAKEIATEYLERAGVRVPSSGDHGPAQLDAVRAALIGAHAALEHIARTVGQRAAAPALPLAPLLALIEPPTEGGR